MTIQKVSGGDGYDYLTRQVAVADYDLERGQSPEEFYAATGEPPGYWLGRGCESRGLSGTVDSAVMRELWSEPQRSAGNRTAVAGFDLIFSPVKSVSTLWAVAPDGVRQGIERAHRAAVADTIDWLELNAVRTQVGSACITTPTTGAVVAAFEHRTSRSGDPALHTHAALHNRGLNPDGRWRALHHLPLYAHTVAASERYNARLEDTLVRDLGLAFEDRPRTDPALRPVREIVGVPDELMRAFSSRRQQIEAKVAVLSAGYVERHGTDPSRSVRSDTGLHQWATLATRPSKRAPRSLAERVAGWREVAHRVLGPGGLDRMLAAVRAGFHRLDPRPLADVARDVRARAMRDRPKPRELHVLAEAERQLRAHPAAIADRDPVVTTVTETVMTMANPILTDAERKLLDLAELGRRVREAKAPSRERQALTAAGDFYRGQVASSWVPTYLATRRLPVPDVGYAPGRDSLVQHLRGRGFTDDEMIRAGLAMRTDRGAMLDWFRDRMVLPLREPSGQVVGFTGRKSPADTNERSPKYLNSPGKDRTGADLFRKSEVLYGLTPDAVERLRRGAPVVFVEGPMDAAAFDVSRETLPRDPRPEAPANAVVLATCGTAFTREHLLTLDRIAPLRDRPVTVVMDPDDAGRAAAVKAYGVLREFGLHDLRTVYGIEGDPAEMLQSRGPEAVAVVWAEGEAPLYDTVVYDVLGRWENPEGWAEKKVGALHEVAPIIAAMPEGQRYRQIGVVCRSLDMPGDIVKGRVDSHLPAAVRLDLPAPPKLASRALGYDTAAPAVAVSHGIDR